MITKLRRCLLAALIAAPAAFAAPPEHVMAWGFAPTERASAYVNELRYGCSGDPAGCLGRYKPSPKISAISIAFTKPETADKNIENATLFSALSLQNPVLREISADDVYALMTKVRTQNKEDYLESLIDAAKSKNPKLKFGVTVYEDEIDKIKNNPNIPKSARDKVDRVAFYLHFRDGIDDYRKYVSEIKQLFPNAAIYGGVYHYDRRDYRKCRARSNDKCSNDDEVRLYKSTLKTQLELISDKSLSGLELYPGFLGEEDKWTHWSNGKICASGRKNECINNSKAMAADTIKELGGK